MKKYIVIDIGGTAIKYGLVDEEGKIIEKHEMKTEAHRGGETILNKVIDLVATYTSKLKHLECGGVAISTAGMVDTKNGAIAYASDLIPSYTGINFKKNIREKFDLPCQVENDVNCAGLAEYRSGSAKASKIMVMLTIGTGIGGCAIIEGKVLEGVGGSAMEVGYMRIGDERFENLASTRILLENIARRKGEDVSKINGKMIFDFAKNGDVICLEEIDKMCEYLAQGLANIAYVLNPDTIVLGGGIMAQGEFLRERIEKPLEKFLQKPIFDKIRLEFAYHKNTAGMMGAFYNFKNKEGLC